MEKEQRRKNIIEDTIRQLGWERAHKSEIVIKALLKVGIDPKNCFFDQHDNLIIPVSEIQSRGLPARFVEDDVIARNDLEKLQKQRINLKCIREVLNGFTLSIFYSASQYSKALLKIDELLKEAGY